MPKTGCGKINPSLRFLKQALYFNKMRIMIDGRIHKFFFELDYGSFHPQVGITQMIGLVTL